jgi:hypothetical protein
MILRTGWRRGGAGFVLPCGLLAALAAAAYATAALTKGGERLDALAHYDRFRPVDGLFDASGAALLPDGRLMVVQDSRTVPIAFLRLEGDRFVAETWTGESLRGRSGGAITELVDLEEAVLSRDGLIYALSSHGRQAAESFARFRLNGERMDGAAVFTGLKDAIEARHPVLARAAAPPGTDAPFNLEGFTFDRHGTRALLGLRTPTIDNKSVVVALDNPAALFVNRAAPQIGELMLLDLDGDGIRGIAWLPKINGYLIAGRRERASAAGKRPFRLWFWSGEPNAKPRAVAIDGLKSMRRPEGIAHVVINGAERILLVSDEGNRAEGKLSEIALIAYERLRIAP